MTPVRQLIWVKESGLCLEYRWYCTITNLPRGLEALSLWEAASRVQAASRGVGTWAGLLLNSQHLSPTVGRQLFQEVSKGLQGLEPWFHPFRGGGGSDCCWTWSARKPQQASKAGAGFLGRLAARGWSSPKKSQVCSAKADAEEDETAWLPHGYIPPWPPSRSFWKISLSLHLDAVLASKYFWHFSPCLLHQPLHLWKENIFTSLLGWLLGWEHSWVQRA